jgi:hypothetical protein
MNLFSKILFWSFAIGVGFMNPLFTVVLVILYYLPKIIQDLRNPDIENRTSEMNSFSDDVLEDMK